MRLLQLQLGRIFDCDIRSCGINAENALSSVVLPDRYPRKYQFTRALTAAARSSPFPAKGAYFDQRTEATASGEFADRYQRSVNRERRDHRIDAGRRQARVDHGLSFVDPAADPATIFLMMRKDASRP